MQGRGRVNLLLASSAGLVVVLIAALAAYLVPGPAAASLGAAMSAMQASATRVAPPVDNQAHLYVLDG